MNEENDTMNRAATVLCTTAARHGINISADDAAALLRPWPTEAGERPRLGALLDRFRSPKSAPVARPNTLPGGVIFSFSDSALQRGDETIRLTEKERDILMILIEAGGRPISRTDLLDRVWAYVDGVETHTLETHIYRLRQKIESDPTRPTLILTDEDGYRISTLVAPSVHSK